MNEVYAQGSEVLLRRELPCMMFCWQGRTRQDRGGKTMRESLTIQPASQSTLRWVYRSALRVEECHIMRERLIERRPDVKPTEDQWMLDRWSSPLGHLVMVMFRELPSKARRYRTVCACGWRSDEEDIPELSACPVKEALDQRERTRKKLEHVVWLPLDKPVSSR